jgi:hypothetical protein
MIGMSVPLLGLDVAPRAQLPELALIPECCSRQKLTLRAGGSDGLILKSILVDPCGLERASTVAMEMATSPRRISGRATVLVARPWPGIPCSERRMSATVPVKSRFQLTAFSDRSR